MTAYLTSPDPSHVHNPAEDGPREDCDSCATVDSDRYVVSPRPRSARMGEAFTYTGSDGGRHFARIIDIRADGAYLVDRGYYGRDWVNLSRWGEVRAHGTGELLRVRDALATTSEL